MISFASNTCWMPGKTRFSSPLAERTDLESDRMLALALIKALEIIGEAA